MKKAAHILFLICVMLTGALRATHNRAGDIIYKRIEPFSKVVGGVTVPVYHYSITVVKYTAHNLQDVADRCEDTVYFGDGERGIAPRINSSQLICSCGFKNGQPIGCGQIINSEPDHIVKLNIYTITHVYAGPGNYLIRSFDPNRNADVVNIPNSVNVPFYLESFLVIDAFVGANTSPQFAFDPIDKACVGQCFEHNPGAYDPDPEDSLSFRLTTSRGYGGQTVPGYKEPEGDYTINPVTGELRWCSPSQTGEYNLAFIVYEWRKNTNGQYRLIGYVLRDMQVIIENCNFKHPPQAKVPRDTCVEAGTLITGQIHVTDQDGGRVVVTGGGGPFEGPIPIAVLTNTEGTTSTGGFFTGFQWQTTCDHARRLPYQATIKVQDNDSPVKQVSFSSFSIRVVPPSIKGVTATPAGSAIRVSWNAPSCLPKTNPLIAYKIYRKSSCDSVKFSPCGDDLSANGYTVIKQVGKDTLFFVDNNNGDGLVVGQNYNYIVTGVYHDGTETFASAGVCSELRRDVPVILNVDVDSTSVNDGVMFVRWVRPLKTVGNLDTVITPGPYTFRVMHKAPGGSLSAVFTSTALYLSNLDTSFNHKGINTTVGPHEYLVDFLAADLMVGSSQRASSVFLHLNPEDSRVNLSWNFKTPWVNERYHIYRKDPGATTYSLINSITQTTYVDSADVRNGFTYCYRVRSEGAYSDPAIFRPLSNFSQDSCVVPVDRTPPCVPTLSLQADCPSGYVQLQWTDVTKICGRSGDVRNYILYHKRTIGDEYIKVAEGNFIFYEFLELPQVSGCYAIQALDTNGNSSPLSPGFCIDNCPIFELPNIFTPNGDGINDAFKAIRVRHIKEIDLFIVDRWGNRIYSTKDPYFQWDGVSSITNVAGNEGTYFYICDVYEPRLKGIVKRSLKGTVHLAR